MRVTTYAIIVLLCTATFCTVLFDSFAAYPHSTRMPLRIDTTAISDGDTCYYTTNESDISTCLQTNEPWNRRYFDKAIANSPSNYEANVGAAKPKSAIFGVDRGMPMWCGRILIVCHTGNGAYNAFLVDGSPKSFSITVSEVNLVRRNISFSD